MHSEAVMMNQGSICAISPAKMNETLTQKLADNKKINV